MQEYKNISLDGQYEGKCVSVTFKRSQAGKEMFVFNFSINGVERPVPHYCSLDRDRQLKEIIRLSGLSNWQIDVWKILDKRYNLDISTEQKDGRSWPRIKVLSCLDISQQPMTEDEKKDAIDMVQTVFEETKVEEVPF